SGLRQAFERELGTDAQLLAEYKAFERMMSDLGTIKDVPVEMPFDLHERISARLDRHLYENKARPRALFGGWWRSVALGGVATLSIIGVIASLNSSGGQTSLSSPVPISAPVPTLSADGINVILAFRASQTGRVKVRSGVDGPII